MPFIPSLPKPLRRAILVILGGGLALLLGFYLPSVSATPTEILWDTYGIPYIYASNNKQLFYSFGWAQAQSHGNLILRLYGQGRGRAAEYWGEDYLDSDRWVRTMEIPTRAQVWYAAQSPEFRRYLDAFAKGVNAYVQAHPEAIADEVEAVLPINGVDLLAHTQQVLHFSFIVNPQQVAAHLGEQPATAAMSLPARGSNGWAIAPSRSASGHALLLANPHLPWSDRFLWYETHLIAPGMDAYGASLVGIPVLNIAFNDHLGWTHTVNPQDGWDAYELKLAEEGYWFDEQVRAFEVDAQPLKVKQADGTFQQEPFTVRRSVHGPVVADQEDTAIALRVVGLEAPGALAQWWAMGRARNFAEFEVALQRLQIPMFTVLYADREGHILHLFNGHVPVRQSKTGPEGPSPGNFDDWAQVLPGDTSATLWRNIHPYRDLPRVLDPPSGWLQNANDPPWTTTLPLEIDPDDYPTYIAPRPFMDFRAQRSARMLAEDQQISFEEMVKYKHSTRMELADRLLDDLIPAARQRGNALARRAAEVLAAWDRQANADSRGAVLFAFWAEAMDSDRLFAIPWSEQSPLTTPDGLADPASAVSVLEAAAAKVESAYGALDVPWGAVFRLHYANMDLPANGADGSLGVFRVLDFAPSKDGRFQAVQGDSYVAAIEFSDPVRARVLTSYGNASQPGSPNVGDQLALFAQKMLRPVWRTRQEIKAHLASHEVF